MCLGILNFTKKYSNKALEECCKQAMVKGIDIFREYFSEYTDQYVLIGGAACDISFGDSNMDFRATRDLDVVLIVEAQTKEFGQRFCG
jgi:hypothetical protein